MSTPVPCRPHPDSRVCMVQGDHLAGCTLTSCTGCVACARHNHPRPTQRPASTSDARKRHAENRPAKATTRHTEGMPMKPQPTPYAEELRAWQARLVTWMGLSLDEVTTIDIVDGAATNSLTRVDWVVRSDRLPRLAERGIPGPPSATKVGDEPIEWRCHAYLSVGEEAKMREDVGPRPEMFTPGEQARLEALFLAPEDL